MITRLTCVQNVQTNPYWNLALEKYFTFHVKKGECLLYLWQNRKTVVIGRNQNAWKECETGELEADGGILARRFSGGGAVYHDLGNLNFSFCVRKEDYNVERQLSVILQALRMLGVAAERSGRNDITVKGFKCSGNAFYKSGDFCCHHGTLMVHVDKEEMTRYLHVSSDKLKAKGVESVRSRVENLDTFCPGLTPDGLAGKLLEAFSSVYRLPAEWTSVFSEKTLAAQEAEEIQRDAEQLASWDWIYGRSLTFTHRTEKRFDWGGLELCLEVKEGRIADCLCYSDAMDQDLIGRLPDAMKGRKYSGNEMDVALSLLAGWRKEEEKGNE